jgi:putative FmdB family regulatory protein
VPRYEYRCRTCDTVFELRRSMADADDAACCPEGHHDVLRRLSTFASVGSAAPPGGPCGGACACAG